MRRALTAISLAALAATAALAQPGAPGLINYQGLLRDNVGEPLATADYEIAFRIYESSDAVDPIWGPQTFAAVPVAQGHFNVILGPQDDLARSLADAVVSQERHLSISVDGDAIEPRQQLLSAPYALTSNVAVHALDGCPPGSILPFGGTEVPVGWLLCDGAAVSRGDFGTLFDAIGTSFGNGDGSTTFNVPDLRGMFLRGTDNGRGEDPNADVRVASASGGATGDNPGSLQGYGTARPVNTGSSPGSAFTSNTTGNHTHTLTRVAGIGGTFGAAQASGGNETTATSTAGNHSHSITGGGNNETRPENVGVNFIIKI